MPEPNEAMVEAASRVLYDWLYEHPDWTGEDILDGDLARSVLAAVSPGCRGAEPLLNALDVIYEDSVDDEIADDAFREAAGRRARNVVAAFRASGEAGPEKVGGSDG
jgi:hypothetical protein